MPLCEAMEVARAIVGKGFYILSGYRSPEYNKKLPGAARKSQHMEGRAADIQVIGYSPEKLHDLFLELHNMRRIRLGGLGLYPTFVHVDVRPGQRLARWTGTRQTS